MRFSVRGLACAAAAASAFAAVGAQTPSSAAFRQAPPAPGSSSSPGPTRSLTIVGLAELPRLLDPQLSPDGQSVLYTLMRADWRLNRQVGHLWRQPVGDGAPIQLTNGDTGEVNGRWSPDGRSLLFLAARPDSGLQVFVLLASAG